MFSHFYKNFDNSFTKRFLSFLYICVLIVLTFMTPASGLAHDLTVAVSANAQFMFKELKQTFEADTGIRVQDVIGSSGKLNAQIENGAPFDVFLSADTDYPVALHQKQLTYHQPQIYAYGSLVLWTMKPLDLSQGLDILTDPSIKKIATATPKTAPYGRASINALRHNELFTKVDKKLVYGESIAQTNQFIMSGASDIGFTSKSTVLSAHIKNQGQWMDVDKGAYKPIAQAAVILKHATKHNLDAAKKFYQFLFSQKAHRIYQNYGYQPAK